MRYRDDPLRSSFDFVPLIVPALVLLAILSGGCGPAFEGDGKVTRLEYDDPDTRWVPGYCLSRDTMGNCTFRMPDRWETDPARWLLHVEQDGKTWKLSVSESVWNDCSIGETYSSVSSRCGAR